MALLLFLIPIRRPSSVLTSRLTANGGGGGGRLSRCDSSTLNVSSRSGQRHREAMLTILPGVPLLLASSSDSVALLAHQTFSLL
ncbi:unnamed protein product [Angiostrongylus costaricensis]|uniref:Secreted protein n=1 Tax=Angiostrongylus costaricensis TaxID=334426 RepID=A0A0R3PT23_ANGCS|nr:unnamed protein product [Angiostrongylus costaricensis]